MALGAFVIALGAAEPPGLRCCCSGGSSSQLCTANGPGKRSVYANGWLTERLAADFSESVVPTRFNNLSQGDIGDEQ